MNGAWEVLLGKLRRLGLRPPGLSSLTRAPDLTHRFLVATSRYETVYWIHLILAALFFSRFLLFGQILFADTDLIGENYPLLLLAKKEFLSGAIGLWNPYDFSGASFAVDAAHPMFFPENWLLFLVPARFFFPAITFAAFLKFWIIGIAAYRLFCAELLDRRWALFASIAYQLSGWVIWCVGSYVALSVFLYYTILLALIWTMPRRGNLANYLLFSAVTAFMLLGGNIAHSAYALLGAGILFVYRTFSHRTRMPLVGSFAVFAASSITALLIFCVRLLPTVDAILAGDRQYDLAGNTADFRNASLLIARFFDTEIFGVNFQDSLAVFPHISPFFDGFHLHAVGESFFGVIAGLLVIWALASEKNARTRFWSVYVVFWLSVATFAQPFDAIVKILLYPIYHPIAAPLLLPVGFCVLAAYGGIALERSVRQRRVSPLTTELFIFAVAVIASFIFLVGIRFHWDFVHHPIISEQHAQFLVLVLLVLGTFAIFIWRLHPEKIRAVLLPSLCVVFVAILTTFLFFHGANSPFTSYVWNIATGLLLFAGIATLLTLILQGRIEAARRVAVWGGAPLLALSFVINLASWTGQLQPMLPHNRILTLGLLGALRFALGLAIFLGLVRAAKTGQLTRRGPWIVCLLLLVAEQVPAGKVDSYINANPFYPSYTLFPPMRKPIGSDGHLADLDLSDYRVNFPNTMVAPPFYGRLFDLHNEVGVLINDVYGVRSYGGVHDMIPTRTVAFLANWHIVPPDFGGFVIYAKATVDRFLDLSGVGYAYNPKVGTVSRRLGAVSRLMLFTQFDVIGNDEGVLARLKAPEFNPLEEVVLQRNPGFQSHTSSENGRKLEYTELGPDRVEVHVHTDAPAVVVFDDSFDPGWTVTVNGVPHEILTANYNFMAVEVPAGESRVIFNYLPRSFVIAEICAVLGTSIMLLGLVVYLVFRLRKPSLSTGHPRATFGRRNRDYRLLGGTAIAILAAALLQGYLGPGRAARAESASALAHPEAFVLFSNAKSDGYPPERAFVGPATGGYFWEAHGPFPIDLTISLPAPATITRYVLAAGDAAANRMPLAWDVDGSTDGKTWIALDSQESVPAWRFGETRTFAIRNKTPVRELRFQFRQGGDPDVLRLYKIELH